MSSDKSSFSQTCSLLRQYLKERGSFGELSLGMSRNLDSNHANGANEWSRPAVTTMNLFPISEKPADGLSNNSSNMNLDFVPQKTSCGPALSENKVAAKEPEAAQMTIFYGGRVFVIDGLDADKAKEIMLFASQQNQGLYSASNPGKEQSSPSANSVKIPAGPGNNICPTTDAPAPLKFDLPIQRKASLHRFLEKRKDRINRTAPYQTSIPSGVPSKLAEADQSIFSKPAEAK